jgi:recombination protein RecA
MLGESETVGPKGAAHLETAVATIQRRWGLKALRKFESSAVVQVPHISTGFFELDEALGIGGLARGRVSEMVGPLTCGKTTLALKFLTQAQVDGASVGYVDYACFLDPDYAHCCGLDLSRLLIVSPHSLEEALSMTEALVGGGGLAALVFDGLDAWWHDVQSAQLLAACLDRLVAPLARSGTTLLFLHISPERDSPALCALAHHATLRLHVALEQWLRRHDDVQGYETRVEVRKNRLGPAGRTVRIAIEFNNMMCGDGFQRTRW